MAAFFLCLRFTKAPAGRLPGDRSANMAATVSTPCTPWVTAFRTEFPSQGLDTVATDTAAAIPMPITARRLPRPKRGPLAGAAVSDILPPPRARQQNWLTDPNRIVRAGLSNSRSAGAASMKRELLELLRR